MKEINFTLLFEIIKHNGDILAYRLFTCVSTQPPVAHSVVMHPPYLTLPGRQLCPDKRVVKTCVDDDDI